MIVTINQILLFCFLPNLLPLQHSQINGFQEIENLDIAAKFKGALMSKAHFPTFLKVIKCPFSCFFHFKCSFVWTKQPSDVLILRMAGTATHSLSEYLKQRRQQKSKLRLKSTSLQLSFQFIKFQRSHASSHSTLEGIQPLHHPSSVTQHFTQKLISPFQ